MTVCAADFPDSIAIIGMGCRVAGADTLDAFWANLVDGVDTISRFTEEELEDSFPSEIRRQSNFVRARSILPDADKFDAAFFGMYPREAETTDPQQRVFMECAWEALEQAGYVPQSHGSLIGVFGGTGMPTYLIGNVLKDRARAETFASSYQVGCYPEMSGSGPDFLATRVAYRLDLRGPAMTIQTACSTALVSVAMACQSLLLHQCDMALAGGVSITFPQKRGYISQEGAMVSEDGYCRPFDAGANGTVFGSGAGVVLLKRLDEALADRDHIHAVIRGCGINNDGADKFGFTAPSPEGQAGAIEMAYAAADVDPSTVGYVECHGTATPLGDPIELQGLMGVFGSGAGRSDRCLIGSVKGNVGHLDVAAGAIGLIKAAMALERETVPRTAHYASPNPRLDIDASPFRIAAETTPWPRSDRPRRAGVSAFGVGGTNVHVVLEEAPPEARREDTGSDSHVVVLSARSATALAASCNRLVRDLTAHPDRNLADVAHTLQVGRTRFPHRIAAVCSDLTEAIESLSSPNPGSRLARGEAKDRPKLAFLFPGQGSQRPGMGSLLFEKEPVFRQEMERASELLDADWNLIDLLYNRRNVCSAAKELCLTDRAQPAIFALEHALARMWLDKGIAPDLMIGHSVGEFVAACLAGVMSFEDALRLVALRGRLMRDLPPGRMLSVRASETVLRELLPQDVELAAVNAPMACVASGPDKAVAELERQLADRGLISRALKTSHAFHSAMMEPMVAPLTQELAATELRAPCLPYISTATGDWISAELATDPAYWGRHARQPVLFAAAVKTALADGEPVFLEVGAGEALTSLTRAQTGRSASVVPGLPDATDDSSPEPVLSALAQLWVAGCEPDWARINAGSARHRVPLPTYPFERSRYFIEAPFTAAQPSSTEASSVPPARTPTTDGVTDTAAGQGDIAMTIAPPAAFADQKKSAVQQRLAQIFEDLSGQDISAEDPATTFLQMGFDSLFLTQVTQELQKQFSLKVSFRDLLGQLGTLPALTDHVTASLPPDPPHMQPPEAVAMPAPSAPAMTPFPTVETAAPAVPAALSPPTVALMQGQLQALTQLMQQQLAALGTAQQAIPVAAAPAPAVPTTTAPPAQAAEARDEVKLASGSRFNVYKPQRSNAGDELTDRQKKHIEGLTGRYVGKTGASKQFTQAHRAHLADPRAASGFNPDWKEMVYPIVGTWAKGSRIRDLDGKEYIDVVNGYGQTMFGHSPDFVVEALQAQLAKGFPIGPQAELAGEVADLFCEMTGTERATFCNTGSEAVMAAMRVARAVTGRSRIVTFQGDYHGQFEEVLVRGATRRGEPLTLPAVVGVLPEAVANMTVLPYGAPESLEWVRKHADELAAVMVEPVQSRHPELRPEAFLKDLRTITRDSDTALIFDEVVTGFRVHQKGMQGVFGIEVDLATYGKVLGGGMPIGVLAGKARFMDALDGGFWRYGDGSIPETGVTFFAGTFVRHPLTLAAARACLIHMKANPDLQEKAAARTGRLVEEVRDAYRRVGAKPPIEAYSSFFYVGPTDEIPHQSLLFFHLRERGIYAHEGFPCFITSAHSEADCAQIAAAFHESLQGLQDGGFIPASAADVSLEATAAADAGAASDTVEPSAMHPTASQNEVWLSAQLSDEASCAFNESVSLALEGDLDIPALQKAVDAVIARHESLRIRFSADGGLFHVEQPDTLAMPVVDLSMSAEPAAELDSLVAQDAQMPFDLVAGPLVRATLVKLPAQRHVLVFTAHHIVCDGWSANIILSEMAALYSGLHTGRPAELETPESFLRYAASVNSDPQREADQAFWIDRFKALPPALELPTDRSRPARKTFSGGSFSTTIGAAETTALKKCGAKHGATLFTTLLSSLHILFGRLSGQSDVVIGVPAAEQSIMDSQGALVGHCVNFLPMRAQWEPRTPFPKLLQQNTTDVLEAYEHQRCTLGTLIRNLHVQKDPSRLPLVEVQFNLERFGDKLYFAGLQAEAKPNPKSYSTFDIYYNVVEGSQGLTIDCTYNSDLFDESTIANWTDLWRHLLAEITEDPSRAVCALPLMDRSSPLASRLEGRRRKLPEGRSIPELIAEQIAQHPDAPAVADRNETISYAELGRRSDQLALAIQQSGVTPGQCVAVCMDRSANLPVTLLAVWKAGACYLPLSPQHPKARRDAILSEAGIVAYLTDQPDDASVPGNAVTILLQEVFDRPDSGAPRPVANPDADRLAYVIYTSGSTGTPKGVEVRERAVVNFLLSMLEAPGFNEGETLVAVTTVAFDIAVLELFLPLVAGGAVHIASYDQARDGFQLMTLLQDSGATAMQATPSTWRMLVEAGFVAEKGFRMMCGGEALPADLATALLQGQGELWNMYGPTETTIWSSVARIDTADGPIGIGQPIANTTFWILDQNDQIAPRGTFGQLHIGGEGLARGYRWRQDLTERAFIESSHKDYARLYRTGDVARILADGSVQIAGRVDRQIKLRGFRIELGEIEAAMVKAGLGKCCAVLREDRPGEKRLVAYYEAAEAGETLDAGIREKLARILPDYMMPQLFMRLDALPLGPTGKIDWRALPAPKVTAIRAKARPASSVETPQQRSLATIVGDILGVENVGIDDDLMTLGADSLSLFRIVAKARETGLVITARDLFECPTIAGALDAAARKSSTIALIPRLSRSNRRPQGETLEKRAEKGNAL